jgi:rRNA maturation protein Rpf1
MRTFCRDLANSIPDVVRVNRGKMSQDGVAEKAVELEADYVIIVERWHGGPGKINLFSVSSTGLQLVPPLMLLSGIRLRRELSEGTRRIQSSAVTIEPNCQAELKKIAEHLAKCFGLPQLSLDEASEGHRASMHFSFDSSQRIQITFLLLERMVEIGPRVTLSKLIWEEQK